MILNNFAWTALVAGQLDEEALSAIQRASDLSANGQPAVLHTLAAIYTTQGNLPGAREVLLKGIDIRGDDEPDADDWYVLGLLAEGYGELDSARAAYRRVEEDEDELGPSSSCYALAQKRLAALGGGQVLLRQGKPGGGGWM
jgi:tetratricopeptide (TPR) repeat protein